MANFPVQRLRRLRANATLRRMVRETHVSPSDLIAPLFMESGEGVRTPIASLPGQHRFSPDTAAQEAGELWQLGIPAVILFGIPLDEEKTVDGLAAYDAN